MTKKLVDNQIAPNKAEYDRKFLHSSVTINSKADYDKAPIEVKHGAATSPKTMAMVCEDLGLIGRWQNNEMEGGKKSFPGDVDFPDDAVSAPAIKEGHLLSGGKEDARDCVNYTNTEMKQFSSDKAFDWRDGSKYNHVHKVKAGDKFDIHWDYTMAHKSRGYSYEITDYPTDFSQRLTFNELKTFYQNISQAKPFWSHPLPASTDHSIILPEREAGFHVLLERWIVADTGMAFHQSWVLEYEASLGGEGPGHGHHHHDA